MAGIIQNKIFQIVIAILIPLLGGFLIGSLYGGSNMYPWYNQIKRPDWEPPSWVFGPVWAFLYISMGYASYRVWSEGDRFNGRAKIPLIIYIILLILNITWTITYFKFHLLGWATVHIISIWILVVVNAIAFYRVDKIAGYLYIPYFTWITLASVLCTTIWRLNADSQ